jgi:putative membrane protein
MISLVIKILGVALGLLFVAWLVPGIEVEDFNAALIAAIILGVLNLTVKPILFVLTLPITILTLGLFTFVINALVFLMAAALLEGFEVGGFIPALLGSLCIGLISTVINRALA